MQNNYIRILLQSIPASPGKKAIQSVDKADNKHFVWLFFKMRNVSGWLLYINGGSA